VGRICGTCGRPVNEHPRFDVETGLPTRRKGKGTVRTCPLSVDEEATAERRIVTARFDKSTTRGNPRVARRARRADQAVDVERRNIEQLERMADED
jgi:succinate dehydrogenase/fumarate reductase-like Fe-S protein